ncbi:uncharacterized protein LOC114429891 [Tachysurus ichikawai]
MISLSPKADLPAGVFLHPMVVPSGELDVNSFRILVKKECLKESAMPVGANLIRAQEPIGPAIQAVNHGNWPDDKNTNSELFRLKRKTGTISMKDGLLYRFSK